MNLKTVNLKKKYIRNGQEFYAVNNVNIELHEKEIVGLVGQSGCGKSTLLNMAAGILKPTEGEIFIDNVSILKQSQKQLANMRRQMIAYVLQGYSLLSNFTILENVCMPLYLAGNKNVDVDAASKILETVGLQDVINSYPTSLSGGEQRRGAIARALMQNPKIIIADEPTSNLDYENGVNVMEALRKSTEYGVAVLISTHEQEFYHYFDRIYEMKKGCII
ncbi:ABC transporter ATP-binding protein [Clostridium sporogenes]|uniref:ABC transporter ATP-binding protein n=1 Tax=Clostridium botulinum TaxID=1491 RepID=A0A6M0SVK5_CLOBO|nr:ABC transporter ATP-binding protein [Clostridium sporogenes]NFA59568.1 ABC transporter ATP-binding protein [Clostridium botulinum]NFI73418.1 ABC transporter ATP-binding protein [Clostridium sporogenes]NFL71470.1 ABC transporter ATP-binding protein [Clostridium sporogenes]NFM23277.1 ABC transporter ATP-binding protein [Clostridium sporogenes]NFP61334.1 ABC transporter ATP-binding protein [Clostridium sporogenes]